MVKRLPMMPIMWETRVQFLGREDLLEKEMATHSSIFAWKPPWMVEPGRLQSMGSQRVGHDWATSLHFWSLFSSFLFLESWLFYYLLSWGILINYRSFLFLFFKFILSFVLLWVTSKSLSSSLCILSFICYSLLQMFSIAFSFNWLSYTTQISWLVFFNDFSLW